MNNRILQRLKESRSILWALIWNMGGICFYYLCRWMINIAAIRLSTNYLDAGTLTLAVSITGIWNVIAFFSVRNIQISDITCAYTDGEYVSFRILTVSVAIFLCMIHALLFTGNINRVLVISIFMLTIASAAYADVLHGILQKHWRMDLIGAFNALRGISILIPFVILFKLFDLLVAVIGMAFFSIVFTFTFDWRFSRKYADIRISFKFSRLTPLIKICFPLMIVSLLAYLIPSVTRMALEKLTDTESLGIYGAVTLPATIIQTVASSAFAPFASIFTRTLSEKNYRGFLRTFWTGILGIVILFLLFYWSSYLFGEGLMALLFGVRIVHYTYLFREATVSCFLISVSWFGVIPLTVTRNIKTILIIYLSGITTCIALLKVMIENFGLSGANYVQIISYAIIAIAILVSVCIHTKKEFKR